MGEFVLLVNDCASRTKYNDRHCLKQYYDGEIARNPLNAFPVLKLNVIRTMVLDLSW